MIKGLKRWVRIQNPKFRFLEKHFSNTPFRLLDIGAGNSSCTKTRSAFPQCAYYGLDLNRDYANNAEDFERMEAFYEMDLTKLEFSSIPDDYFDAILIVHVIEHLHNGDAVIAGLIPKLKAGGVIYVEYPGKKSLTLPSMKGTLNYYDDSSHVRVYSVEELKKVFDRNGCTVLRSGLRRSWFYIMVMPLRILRRWMLGRSVTGNIFWDVLGFAEFLEARKQTT